MPCADVHDGHGFAPRHQTRKRLNTCPRLHRGELRLQAFGVTEPTSGTDTTALRTTARREGDKYIVNGQKIWISRAEHSDLMVLLARTTPRDQVAKKTDGLSVFLVDMRKVQGLTIRPIRTMMNHATTELFFDNMEIPADSLIGEEGKGFRYILSGMNAERYPDRGRVCWRRQMVHRKIFDLRLRPNCVRPSHRPEPGRAVPYRQSLCRHARGRVDAARGDPIVRGR